LLPPRFVHSAIHDPVRDRMIVFGGFGQTGASNEVWALTWGSLQAPPVCAAAVASEPVLWPPNHKLRPVTVTGVTDPEGDPLTMTVTRVTQNEPVTERGDGKCPDATISGSHVMLRAERSPAGNGRLYEVQFTADDGQGGRCDGVVTVCVPRNPNRGCTNDGQRYDSTAPCDQSQDALADQPILSVAAASSDEIRILFTTNEAGRVDVSVFDVTGRRHATLESGDLPMGIHERSWHLDDVPRGLYFVRMRAGATITTRSVLVTR
jgi:hypothetical protein